MEESRASREDFAPETAVVDDNDDGHMFATSTNDEDTCKQRVLSVLGDICPLHLDALAKEHAYDAQLVLTSIMDKQEKGEAYPRQSNPLKRKWDSDSDEDSDAKAKENGTTALHAKINDPVYASTMLSPSYKTFAVTLIGQDFAMASKTFIKKLLSEKGSVLRTYTAMDDARRAGNDADKRMWADKKCMTPVIPAYAPENIAAVQRDHLSANELAALDEFVAARASRDRRDAALAEEAKELANIEQAKSRGEMGECGCCFEDIPLNRMVHCADDAAHSFCRNCLKQQAEVTVGCQKYELTCMAMEGCHAGFSLAQREASLDKKLRMALDRIEQQAMLDAAGLDGLETCPFCPYAMEYPPVEVDKEFRCENPSCYRVSCRLCRKPTHIPKSCAEATQDEAHDFRHTIEEAMSKAMIRKCNKCKNPFIKEEGCNKIYCTRCRTVQCYICRQTVTGYNHFNDVSRGGKPGQCPLYDATEARHQHEVQRAEEDMRKKLTQERPDLVGDALNFKMSSRVEKDEEERREMEAKRHPRRLRHFNAAAEMARRYNQDPPNVHPQPQDGPGADPGQRPAVADVPPVRKPAANPDLAASLPLQSPHIHQQHAEALRYQQQEAEAWRASRLLLEKRLNRPAADRLALGEGGIGHEAMLRYGGLLREHFGFHPRNHLPQAVQPQAGLPPAARPPAAWPQECQFKMARRQAEYQLKMAQTQAKYQAEMACNQAKYQLKMAQHQAAHLSQQLGVFAGPILPPGQPLNGQLQPSAGPSDIGPGVPISAQQAQQAQQNQQGRHL